MFSLKRFMPTKSPKASVVRTATAAQSADGLDFELRDTLSCTSVRELSYKEFRLAMEARDKQARH